MLFAECLVPAVRTLDGDLNVNAAHALVNDRCVFAADGAGAQLVHDLSLCALADLVKRHDPTICSIESLLDAALLEHIALLPVTGARQIEEIVARHDEPALFGGGHSPHALRKRSRSKWGLRVAK